MGLLNLLFPPKCVFCGKILKAGQRDICPGCADNLPYTEGRAKQGRGDFFDVCVSPLYYRGIVRESFLRYKFSGKRSYAPVYGRMLAACVREHLGEFDLITWVPVSKRRLRERGYDQSELLCSFMAAELGKESTALLKKIKENPAQSSLVGAEKRRANVLGAYKVLSPEKAAGKRILLVDDIFTTGATLSECARTLLMAGGESVVCATFARKE